MGKAWHDICALTENIITAYGDEYEENSFGFAVASMECRGSHCTNAESAGGSRPGGKEDIGFGLFAGFRTYRLDAGFHCTGAVDGSRPGPFLRRHGAAEKYAQYHFDEPDCHGGHWGGMGTHWL